MATFFTDPKISAGLVLPPIGTNNLGFGSSSVRNPPSGTKPDVFICNRSCVNRNLNNKTLTVLEGCCNFRSNFRPRPVRITEKPPLIPGTGIQSVQLPNNQRILSGVSIGDIE
jgi:hypothetical protein